MSSTHHLRNFTNEQKLNLLERWMPCKNAVLLDMAGGKGYDLFKFQALGVSHVDMCDFSSPSVDEALRRYRNIHNPKFSFTVRIADMRTEDAFPRVDEVYDMVSCQFAIHHIFSDPERYAASFFERVAKCMKKGGTFVFTATIPEYVQVFRNNSICQIELLNGSPTKTSYHFKLDGLGSGFTEHFVHLNTVLEVARRAGLWLLEYERFYDAASTNETMSSDERQVAYLYCSYAFVKH